MSREAEFIHYQHLFTTYAARLNEAHMAIGNLDWRKVKVTDEMIDATMNGVYMDSRSDEERLYDELYEWVVSNKGVVPLFDYRTLSLVSGSEPDYIHRNTHGYVRKITELSDGYGDIQGEPWRSGKDISFKGFYDFQIDMFVNQMRTMAEDALEKLRNIGTTLIYMRGQRLPLSKVYDAGPTPDAIASDKTYDDGAPMFGLWWLTHVCGDNSHTAGGILENFTVLCRMTHPDPEHPPLLNTFSSFDSNRVSLTYVEKEAA